MKNFKIDTFFVIFLIGLGIASRLIPHPWNFTAIGTMALFSGFSFRSNNSLMLVPFVSLILSDYLIGFYDGMAYTYIGFFVGMGLSLIYFSKNTSLSFMSRILTFSGLSVVSSFLFFLITNFGVWYGSAFYAQNSSGLLASYIAGLPFLFNQLTGDLFFGAVAYGCYEYLNGSARQQAKQTV